MPLRLEQVEGVRNPRARQRAFCISAGPNENDLGELKELLRTAGVAVTGELTQRRPEPDPDRYFGRGKLAELKDAIAESGANLVACDDELKPRQERNLEQALDVPVIDRTAIILDIFADHAHSAEGKLQVELAQLEYNLARMRARLYSSWASSTWSLPSAEWAWSAKMSRMIAVRSITGMSSACSRLRS